MRTFAASAPGRALVVLVAGLVVGALYWAIGVTSPAPPPIGLVGLLGIVIGEFFGRQLVTRAAGARAPAASIPCHNNEETS